LINQNLALDNTTQKLLQNSVLKKQLPFKNNFIEVKGHFMHYLDEGTKKGSEVDCILLLHGNPTWSFFYRNLIKELSKTHRVIAPDLIGLGLSERVDDVFRAADRIDQLEEFLKKLSINSYSLVMHDWGGSIGSALALRDLEKVKRLVYLNTTLTETESLPAFIKTAAMPIIGKYVTKTSNRFLKFLTTLGAQKKVPKDIKKCFFLPYKTRDRRKAIWDFVADIPFDERHPSYGDMLSLAEGLPEIAKKPVKIVWGLKDPCFHREMLTKVSEHFPDAEVHELPNASHLLLEDSCEEACSSISEFFAKDISQVNKSKDDLKLVDLEDTQGFYPYVKKLAVTHPENIVTISPSFIGDKVHYLQNNYKDLITLVNKYQRGLQDLGLNANDKVVMLVPPSIDFLAISYAVMGRGAIPCFLDPGMGKEKLLECIKDLKPEGFIASPKAHLLKVLHPKYFKSVNVSLIASDWIPFYGKTLSFLKKYSAKPLAERKSSGIAMLAFTSGATGSPKAVSFTDKMIKSQLEIFKSDFNLEIGKKDMPLLPIFSLFNGAIGVTSIFPPLNSTKPIKLNPAKIVKLLKEQRINYSFGSPALWRKIGEYCLRSGTRLDDLEKIHIAGAAVDKSLFDSLKEITKATLATPYGATEALPVTLATANELESIVHKNAITEEAGTCVGKSISAVEIKVIKASDEDIENISNVIECSPLEIGELVVKGENVNQAYFIDSKLNHNHPKNKASKIKDGEVYWHRMGDMVYLDENKNIYFCGRKVHRVIYNENILYSVPVEKIFNTHKRVARSALVKLKGGKPAVVIEPDPKYWPDTDEKISAFKSELLELAKSNAITSSISDFYFNQSFPVDGRHNAKIFRDQLGEWASDQ
jgi:acyl-CoA synthetase (AMP-forming)/AMP-acid ligase II/pimeloyl-ACP methyl ester carboxylesterase